MACYAALISLKQTIERLVNSSQVSILPPSEKITYFAYNEVDLLLETVPILGRRENDDWVAKIREAVWTLEDSIELHVSNQFLSQYESIGNEVFSSALLLDLKEVGKEYICLCQTVLKVMNWWEEEEDDDDYDDPLEAGGGEGEAGEEGEKEEEEEELERGLLQPLLLQWLRPLSRLPQPLPPLLLRLLVLPRLLPRLLPQQQRQLQQLWQLLRQLRQLWQLWRQQPLQQRQPQPRRQPWWQPQRKPLLQQRQRLLLEEQQMVGFFDEFIKLKTLLIERWWPDVEVVTIVGMAGIGKTMLAMQIFNDSDIASDFDRKAFVEVGPEYNLETVLEEIACGIYNNIDDTLMEEDEDLCQYLFRILRGKRFLIVLDDVWDRCVWDELRNYLPDDLNKSRVLLTTRLEEVVRYANDYGFHRIRFLNKEESWELLRKSVFGERGSCPFQLEKHGKKIAENCEGLPLTIITVANSLREREKTVEYWMKVSEKDSSVFIDAYDEILEVLYPSYNYLPQYLKPCFLYMGVFRSKFEISTSKLFKLWSAEGFLEPDPSDTSEDLPRKCLGELASKSLVVVGQQRSIWINQHWASNWGIKSCSLHSVFRHLCIKEAGKEKFFHIINRYVDSFTEGIKSQRRLSIQKNILFGIKNVHELMESISTTRSLLCTGPFHQYPVRICFGLKSLRVMDALTVRFYKFPIEVLELVQLRYLALTCNGEVPASISRLWILEYLIIHRHLSIKKSSEDWSYLPIEIWNMQVLRHLQVMGSNLQDPCGAILPNLLTLSDVSAHSCTKEILKGTPNLEKLGIQIELAPDGVAEPLSCFDHLSLLRKLKSFKCAVLNPNLKPQVVVPPTCLTTFPISLAKLSLSGFGYPWENMRVIAKLPNLQVLKLRCYAFRGPEWVIYEEDFPNLEFLLLEDTDLVRIRGYGYSFQVLTRVIFRHCYKLKKIGLRNAPMKMDLVDCPSAEASVKQIQKECPNIKVCVQSSLDDEEVK